MATKVYTVLKDGVTIKETKTLPSAKKAADENGAEVFCDGQCVYKAETATATATGTTTATCTTTTAVTAEPVVAETPKQPEVQELVTEQYRLKALMNIRQKPSADSLIVGVKPAGTVVRVTELEDDWLQLIDGSYILYDGGKFAEKV